MSDTDVNYKVQNVLTFLGEKRPEDVLAWGYADNPEAALRAIESVTRSNKRAVCWMIWERDTGAKHGA